MAFIESFITPKEDALNEEFLEKGYVIKDVDCPDVLYAMRHMILEVACELLEVDLPDDETDFLNLIHEMVDISELNGFRLAIYNKVNEQTWFRPTYFRLGRNLTEKLVGNELAMQNQVNLSIQMPNDNSSLIGIHSDAFSGETPFQIVQWVPLVDAYDTKSMFLLPPENNRRIFPQIRQIVEDGNMDLLFEEVKDQVVWLTVPYGKVLIFSPNLLHGNVVNQEKRTRWSLNCRFTGLFTPYTSCEKSLGGFYLPITTRIVSRVGMNYQTPKGFDE